MYVIRRKVNEMASDDGIAFFLMFYVRNYVTDFSGIIAGDY
jgi:hypothetical protein